MTFHRFIARVTIRRAAFGLLLLSSISLFAQAPKGTGVDVKDATGTVGPVQLDTNFFIVGGLFEEDPSRFPFPTGAFVVTKLATGWAPALPGTKWVGPSQEQDEAGQGTCCQGVTTYRTTFNIADPAGATLTVTVLADDSVRVLLGGKSVFNGPVPGYANRATFTVTVPSGSNTMDFIVDNSTGGPSGLDVSFSNGASGPTGYPDVSPVNDSNGMNAKPEPVDGATGQYYDTFTDLRVGGPLSLAFRRYYASRFSATGFTTSLGVNWMHNFDAGLRVSGANASVLLFTGKLLKFTNSAGNWKLVSPTDVPYQLLQSSAGYALVDPPKNLRYGFSLAGALQSITDRNGNAIAVTQGTNGPTQASWGPFTLTFTYTGKQLTSVRDQTGREVRFAYTNGLLTSFTDVNQQTTTYSYTAAGKLTGLLTARKLPLGEVPTTQTYDDTGRVTSQTDPNNNTDTIAYDGKGGTTITDARGNVTKQGFDTNGDIAQFTGPLGGTSKFTYDSSYHRTSVTDRTGNAVSYSYDPASGQVASRTDPAGNATKYTYTVQSQNGANYNLLTGLTYADGTTTSLGYDNQGNLITATLRDGITRKNTYDQFGRRTSATAANGATTKFAYNSDFTVASVEDALGNRTTSSYDANGRLSKITDPNGSVIALAYNAGGALTSFTNRYGNVLTYSYDADGRLAQRSNAYGGTGTYTWNADGTPASYTDALGNVRQFQFDSLQRLSSYTNALGQTIRFTRDAVGHLLRIAGDSGTRVTYTYNAEGRRTSRQDALGRAWSYGIDAFGRRSSITSPLGNKTSFLYDKLGRSSGVTDALGRNSTVQLDAMGRSLQISLPGGLTTKIARNSLGLATSITDPNGNAWTRDYDVLGRLIKRTDPLGNSTSYTYTGTRLTGATMPTGTLAIATDVAGHITQRKYSDGTTLNYSYDVAGQIVTADGVAIQRDVRGRITASNGITAGRDALGRINSLTYADGKTINYTYDSSGKLAQLTDWAGGVTTFTYDAAGQMISMQRANGVPSNFAYDADGRLINISTGSLASIALTRDAIGRIVSADRNLPLGPTIGNSAQTYSYDAASQLNAATYDSMGRVTAQAGRTYSWDGASRLTSFTDGGTQVSLAYDSLGEMSSMTAGGTTRNFVFNYALRLPALSVVQQNGADLRYYVYLPNGKLLYSIESADNSRHFYHFDESGNTAFLTDDGGAVTDTYGVTPYGEVADHPGTSDNPFTFQGQDGVLQEAPGLYYMRSRHYDAATARFLSRDPAIVADPRGVAPYGYTAGNPVTLHDPLANDWEWYNPFSWFAPETPPVQPPDPPAPDYSTDAAPVAENPPDAPADPAPYSDEAAAANSDTTYVPQAAADPTPTLDSGVNPQTVPPAAAESTGGHCCDGSMPVALIGQDGSGLIGQDGSGLIGQDGSGLIGQDGSGLIGQDGSGLIGQDGSGLLGKGGGGLLGNRGSG